MSRFCIKYFQFATNRAWLCQEGPGEQVRLASLGEIMSKERSLLEFPSIEDAQTFMKENDTPEGRGSLVCEVHENIHGIWMTSV
jgi:hypothetical protein